MNESDKKLLEEFRRREFLRNCGEACFAVFGVILTTLVLGGFVLIGIVCGVPI